MKRKKRFPLRFEFKTNSRIKSKAVQAADTLDIDTSAFVRMAVEKMADDVLQPSV